MARPDEATRTFGLRTVSILHMLRRNTVGWISLALAVATFLLYWPVQNFEFIDLDDPIYVTANPLVQAGWTSDSIHAAFTTSVAGYWFPVTLLSHILDYTLFGEQAGYHHLVNVGFHILATVLLFLFLWRATRQEWPSGTCQAL